MTSETVQTTTWQVGAWDDRGASYVYVKCADKDRALQLASEHFAAICKRYARLTVEEA